MEKSNYDTVTISKLISFLHKCHNIKSKMDVLEIEMLDLECEVKKIEETQHGSEHGND